MIALTAFVLVAAALIEWTRRIYAVSIPDDRRLFVVVCGLGAVLGVVALIQGTGWLGGIAAGFAVLGGSFLCFTVSISAQAGGTGVLRVGAPLPMFSALDENGVPFELASVVDRPILLKFFRGHW